MKTPSRPLYANAPPPPTQFFGREKEVAEIKKLLTKLVMTPNPGVVRLAGARVKEAQNKIVTREGALTRARLAKKTGYGERVITKALGGKLIKLDTALAIATALDTELRLLLAPPAESVALQTVVVVRGIPGVGKTTLARWLAHQGDLREAFPDGILFASLGVSPDILTELMEWGKALELPGIDDEKSAKFAHGRLAAALSDKQVLLIIDDAWTDEAAMEMMVGGPRCATVVTTRITEVADALAPTEDDVYLLGMLSEGDAVRLLQDLAENAISKNRKKALEMAKELECLPLALQVAGRLLRAEERKGLGVAQLIEQLRDAARLLPKNAPGGRSVSAILRTSTDALDDSAFVCFVSLAPFPNKPATFDLKALGEMWKLSTADLGQMADVLTARGLLEPVEDGRYWLHALLLAHAKALLAELRKRGSEKAPGKVKAEAGR